MVPFESRWALLEPGGFLRVDEDHPLDFYVGLDVSGDCVLLLIIQDEIRIQVQSQAISVTCRKRNDGRWALMFRLIRMDLRKIFSHLCDDLVESSRKIPEKSSAARFILARFEHWQRLLKHGHTGVLEQSAVRGLIGELLYIREVALIQYGPTPSIEGWMGPQDAAQDFYYSDCIIEVKTIHTGASRVVISSAEQLSDCGNPLYLVVVTLDSAEQGNTGAFCLIDIVNEMRPLFEPDAHALSLFEERIAEAGFIDNEVYKNYVYKYNGIRYYSVKEGFPRITKIQLPIGIEKVKYEIDLEACKDFVIS